MILCYSNIVDKENLWRVLYALRGLEQAMAAVRLGPTTVFDPKHPSIHWLLDLSHPSHEEVARKLVNIAAADAELPNFWNIRLNGTTCVESNTDEIEAPRKTRDKRTYKHGHPDDHLNLLNNYEEE